MGGVVDLARKGIGNPARIPGFVLARAFPGRFREWKREDGVVTWNTFDWGDGNDPAQRAAINYHLVQALRRDLAGERFGRALEIGCGYGRVTPWLGEFADEVVGLEPNDEMRDYVEAYLPGVETVDATAQDMPIEDRSVDLVFTRSVLQHVDDRALEAIGREIERVTTDDAMLLLCEAVEGEVDDESLFVRSPGAYAAVLPGFDLVDHWKRETPAKTRVHRRRRMRFERR
jgi:SAM-dependent methyltransferase